MRALGRCLFICFATFAVASCEEDNSVAVDEATGAPDLLADQRQACERRGGRWGLRAGDALFICFEQARDANQSCSKASDCDGVCLARSRTCSPEVPFLGCHETLTEAGFPATVCVN